METYIGSDAALRLIVYGCIGYIFGALVMCAAAVSRGIAFLAEKGLVKRQLVAPIQLLHAVVAFGALFVLSMLIGRAFEGQLSQSGSIVMLVACALTVLAFARVFISLGVFRSGSST
jgi:hypothetical protein